MVAVLLLAQLHMGVVVGLSEPAEALGAMVVEAILTALEVGVLVDIMVVVVTHQVEEVLPQTQLPLPVCHKPVVMVEEVVVVRVKLLGLVPVVV
jgi:ABC-type molybdenum transport system ATPase subunit/photorepair protein PhrA